MPWIVRNHLPLDPHYAYAASLHEDRSLACSDPRAFAGNLADDRCTTIGELEQVGDTYFNELHGILPTKHGIQCGKILGRQTEQSRMAKHEFLHLDLGALHS